MVVRRQAFEQPYARRLCKNAFISGAMEVKWTAKPLGPSENCLMTFP